MSNYTYSLHTNTNTNTNTLYDYEVIGSGAHDISPINTDSKLLVEGRDVMREIDEMRDALLLLKRHVDMEEKYPRLRELQQEYQDTLEKYLTLEALK